MKTIRKIIIPLIIILIILLVLLGRSLYNSYRVEHAKKIVVLKTKDIEVYSNTHLKDIIKSINGKLIENKKINTDKIGKEEVSFDYITDDNIKVNYKITVNIKDTTPPIISYTKNYYVPVNSKKNLEKEIFCGDNYDNTPTCKIEGDYDLSKKGTYNVNFVGIDQSNNKSVNNINIIVYEKTKSNNSTNSSNTPHYVDYKDILTKYKTKTTKVGIDVSHWQGTINYKALKKAGVEFVYIRVGRGEEFGEKNVLDDKFKTNIENANKEKIPVGVYFYSDAKDEKSAIKEAKWVIKQIKKYKVDLEVVFDWENWTNFQDYSMSFHTLTDTANAFTKNLKKAGYKTMVYSSKNYLENMWYPLDSSIWLAHYTDKTDYSGKYKVWQLSNNGKVDGINAPVDIDIRYE